MDAEALSEAAELNMSYSGFYGHFRRIRSIDVHDLITC
jgi:hypothetical protein